MLLFTVYLAIEHIINFLVYEVHKQHHTLTQILMGLLRTEFVLDAVEKCRAARRYDEHSQHER